MPFADTNMTVDNALDTRKMCDSVKWSTAQDDRNQTVIEYDCNYKGIDNSGFLQNDSPKAASAGDVWQWTYGADGRPELTGVAIVIRRTDGTVTTVASGGNAAGQFLSKLINNNPDADFDHVYSAITGKGIPFIKTKPAKEIPDSVYGNQLAQFYPDKSPRDAAVYANIWKFEGQNVAFGQLDAAGYLQTQRGDVIKDPSLFFAVDPADVQYAVKEYKDDGSGFHGFGEMPNSLKDNKLLCVMAYCYDSNAVFVGKAPPEVLSKEAGAVDSIGLFYQNAQAQERLQDQSQQGLEQSAHQIAQPQQDAHAPSQEAMQQAAQQDTTAPATASAPAVAPASASTADSDLPTGTQDWPASTPCIKKLEDAYRKDRQAHSLDDTISMDQDNDFASTCKTVGQ